MCIIALVGPPVYLWNPQPFVKSWLVASHPDATAINTRSRIRKQDDRAAWHCV